MTGRFESLMERLGWHDEWTPEARVLLDMITAAETYRERVQHHIRIVQLTATQLAEGLRATRPNLARLVPEATETDAAMAAYKAAADLLEKFLSVHGVVE